MFHGTDKNRQQATHGPWLVNSYSVEEKRGKTIYSHFVQKLTTSCGNSIENFFYHMFDTHDNLAVCMIWHFLIIRTRWHPISLEHLLIGSYSPSWTPSFLHTLFYVLHAEARWAFNNIHHVSFSPSRNSLVTCHLLLAFGIRRKCLILPLPDLISDHSLCPELSRAFVAASFSPRHSILPQVLAWLVFLGNSELSSNVTSFLWPGPVSFSS